MKGGTKAALIPTTAPIKVLMVTANTKLGIRKNKLYIY